MRKFILLAAILFAAVAASAQYYYPNPYQTQQSYQAAYEYGQRIAVQMQQQHEQMLRNNPMQMRGALVQAIAEYQDEKAYGYAEYLAENSGTASDWYWLGVLNEAGIYDYSVEYAKECYRNGAAAGGNGASACRQRLASLANGDELSTGTVRNYCMQIVTYGNSVTLPDFNSGSSSSYDSGSSNSSSNTRGGVCQRCHGTRIDPILVDYNPGSRTASDCIPAYTRCPYCGETYSYKHWHQRCLDCSAH